MARRRVPCAPLLAGWDRRRLSRAGRVGQPELRLQTAMRPAGVPGQMYRSLPSVEVEHWGGDLGYLARRFVGGRRRRLNRGGAAVTWSPELVCLDSIGVSDGPR